MRLILAIIFTLFCLAFALWPEALMVWLWHKVLVPTEFWERWVTVFAFAVIGGPISLITGILGLGLWAHIDELF